MAAAAAAAAAAPPGRRPIQLTMFEIKSKLEMKLEILPTSYSYGAGYFFSKNGPKVDQNGQKWPFFGVFK